MKRIALIFLLLVAVILVGCNSNDADNSDVKTFTIDNISLDVGESKDITLAPGSDAAGEITYSFEGNNIKIENGKVTGLVNYTATIVTATAGGYSTMFAVTVKTDYDYGTLEIPNVDVAHNGTASLAPVFSVTEYASDIEYTFDGNNIKIENGVVTGLVNHTKTVVTATTDYHTEMFVVTVETPDPIDCGELIIVAPNIIYTNYPAKPLDITFTKPEYAGAIEYSASVAGVKVENGKIYAEGDGFASGKTLVTVTANTEYHTTTFDVNVATYYGPVNTCESKAKYYEANVIK